MNTKKKKNPKNAFSFFLDDYVENQREAGRHISHKVAAEECGPLWKNLPPEEKQRYSQIASAFKMQSKNDKCNKFTNIGISYAELERFQEEAKEKTRKADCEIKSTISNLDLEKLKTHLFYIIHCNYYCKTDDNVYVPGEIAISEFSLKDGIRRTYHTLINPGQIPLGYAYEAKQTIEEVHGLPTPPYEEGESDYFGILHNILKFLEPGKLPDGKYPPLYCIENNIRASESIIQALSDNKSEGKDYFRVFLLHKMFFWLKNKCVEYLEDETVGFPVVSNAEMEIKKDTFCFLSGISCAFHATSEDKYHNCSLSIVQRLVYIICDHCCEYLGVNLIPGKHCRLNCDVDRNKRTKQSEKSSERSFLSPPPSEIADSDFDGRSSYCDEATFFDWNKRDAASFLHDELEYKFDPLEFPSLGPKKSSWDAPSESNVFSRPGRSQNDSDEEKFSSGVSIGRGRLFR